MSSSADAATDATDATDATTAAVAHMTREPDGYRREGRDGRSIVARWILRVNDDGSKELAALYMSHRGAPSYCYRASLNRTTMGVDNGDGGTVETSAPMEAVEVIRKPAKRYNAKILKEFVREAVAAVADPANADRLVMKFDATTASCGTPYRAY